MESRAVKIWLAWLMLLSLVMISIPGCASGRSYSVKNYDIYLRLQPDGSALVTETIEYYIQENLRDFSYKLQYAPAGSIDLEKIGVADKPAAFDKIIFVEAQRAQDLSSPVRPLTYHLRDNGEVLQITLHVFSEADAVRTVSLSYYLSRMVTRHSDSAVLQHRFFSSGVEGDIENARITIRLPQSLALAETWNLPVSLADFTISQPREDQIRFSTDFISAGDSVALTTLLPRDLFPEAAPAAEPLSRETLISDARSRDDLLQRRYETEKSLLNLIYVLLALSLIISLVVYGRFDREVKPADGTEAALECLCALPPAVLAVLMKKKKPGNLLLSTLFDLVRRGELERDGLVFFRKSRNNDYIGCRAYEIFLLQWLFDHLADEDAISITEIRRFARNSSTAAEFQIYYRQFCALIQEAYDEAGYIDKSRTSRGRMINTGISLGYLILGFVFTFTLQMSAGIVLFAPALWFFIYSLILRRRSTAGVQCYEAAKKLSRQMKQPEKTDPEYAASLLSRCLPQAIALDRAVKLLQAIVPIFPDGLQEFDNSRVDIYGINIKGGRWTASAAALAEDIKVMDSLLSASYLLASGIHS